MTQLTTINPDVNFKVGRQPVYAKRGSQFVQVPDRYETYRLDNGETLGVVGSRYKVQQHTDNLAMAEQAIAKLSHNFSAEHFIEGARIMSRYTMHDLTIMQGDSIEASKLAIEIINTYDGSRCFEASLSVWRQICTNGMMGFAKAISLRKRHVKSLFVRSELTGLAESVEGHKEAYEIFYKGLRDKPVIDRETLEEKLPERLVKSAREVYPQEYAHTQRHTAWTQYNAFTSVISHKENVQEARRQQLSTLVSNLYLSHFAIGK